MQKVKAEMGDSSTRKANNADDADYEPAEEEEADDDHQLPSDAVSETAPDATSPMLQADAPKHKKKSKKNKDKHNDKHKKASSFAPADAAWEAAAGEAAETSPAGEAEAAMEGVEF